MSDLVLTPVVDLKAKPVRYKLSEVNAYIRTLHPYVSLHIDDPGYGRERIFLRVALRADGSLLKANAYPHTEVISAGHDIWLRPRDVLTISLSRWDSVIARFIERAEAAAVGVAPTLVQLEKDFLVKHDAEILRKEEAVERSRQKQKQKRAEAKPIREAREARQRAIIAKLRGAA